MRIWYPTTVPILIILQHEESLRIILRIEHVEQIIL